MASTHLKNGFDNRPNVSRTVGWAPRYVPWPGAENVEKAIADKDAVQLLTWRRFLGPAESPEQLAIINRIVEVEASIRRYAESVV